MSFKSVLIKHKDDYRADITGLRGVDIFFTISGFLITKILISNDLNTHSYINFYKRRIKRILPALLFMMAFISIAAYVVFLPEDLKNYTHSLTSAVLYFSNLYFITTMSSGYFGTHTDTIPLIHTWSLSIEEQYYLFFPILLVLTKGHKKNIVVGLLLVFSIMSLLLCNMARNRPLMLYYSPLTHGFPLFLGSIVAILTQKSRLKISRVLREFLAFLAISLILCSGVYIPNISYPNYLALIPCAASLILIFIGGYKTCMIDLLLSNKVMVSIGLASYSLYLWHWPIFALGNYVGFHNDNLSVLVYSLLTATFGAVSFLYVEEYFRRVVSFSLMQCFTCFIFLPSLVAVILMLSIHYFPNIGFNYIDPGILKQSNTYYGVLKKSSGCMRNTKSPLKLPDKYNCLIGLKNPKKIELLLVGDSHAMAYVGMMDEILKDANLTGYVATQSGSPYIIGDFENWRQNKPIGLRAEIISKEIKKHEYKYVVFAGFWNLYKDVRERNKKEPSFKAFKRGFDKAIKHVLINHSRPVILLDVPPLINLSHLCGYMRITRNSGSCYNELSEVQQIIKESNKIIMNLKEKYPEIILIDPKKVICNRNKCYNALGGIPLYMSGGTNSHLNYDGSVALGLHYLRQFNNPFGAA